MYVRDGIAYAGETMPPIKVWGIRPMQDYVLWVRFSNGEVKTIDFKPLLSAECFKPLSDPDVFRNVYIDYGCPVWNNGDIDIAPEYLYENGRAEASDESA